MGRGYRTRDKGTVFSQESLGIFSNAEKVLLAPDENLASADGWRSVGAFANEVFSDQFKLWSGPYDPGYACIRHKIYQPTSGDRCRAVSLAHSILPMPFARLGLETTGDAAIGYGQEIIAHDNW